MMYRVPMPSRTNGIKIHTFRDHSIGIEYQTGEPHLGKLAYDSSCGVLAKNISFRPSRPDIDKIIADAVRQVDGADAMPKAGKSPLKGSTMDNDNDDNDAALGKILDFLESIISPDDLEIVQALFSGASDVDEAREAQAIARRDDDRRTGRQAGDQAVNDIYRKTFPGGAADIDKARGHRLAVEAQRAKLARRAMSDATEDAYLKMFPLANRLA